MKAAIDSSLKVWLCETMDKQTPLMQQDGLCYKGAIL